MATNTNESIYDEIPFYEPECLPINKDKGIKGITNHIHSIPTPVHTELHGETSSNTIEIVMKRRKAINGEVSDEDESDDCFSSDSFSSQNASNISVLQSKISNVEYSGAQSHTYSIDVEDKSHLKQKGRVENILRKDQSNQELKTFTKTTRRQSFHAPPTHPNTAPANASPCGKLIYR